MSQHIIAISWSHQQTPLDFRDKLALSRKEVEQFIHLLVDSNHIFEAAALSTCNRIEFYALVESSKNVLNVVMNIYNNYLKRNILWHQSSPVIYASIDAVQHLFRVAAGMESMVLGEIQILSQVKAAHQILIRSQPDGNILGKLFKDAIHSAETFRNDSPLYFGPTSISELAVITAKKIYDDLEKRKVLIIGAGETAKLSASFFKSSGLQKIIIANRSEKRGETLSKTISADYINIQHINDVLNECDILVTSTNASDYLINRSQVENIMSKRTEKFLLLDLCSPRNIEPSIRDIDNVCLYDLDYLYFISRQNMEKNIMALDQAERMIKYNSRKVLDWFQSIDLKDTKLELIEEED